MSDNGKVAIVTGGGTGVGKSSALALAREGFSVAIAGRREGPLQDAIKEAGEDGSRMLAVSADVGKPDDVKKIFAETMGRFGRLDLLFNNAGTGAPRVPLEDLPYEEWMKVVDVNLTGSFLCTQEAIKIMKNQNPMGGRIINNGSISAHAPRPGSIAYTATKHAVTGLTKSTSLDCRQYNIICSQIDIGNAETPMTQRMSEGVMQPNGQIMVEPTMDVESVAQAVVYISKLPMDTNVLFMTVMANLMPFVGRG